MYVPSAFCFDQYSIAAFILQLLNLAVIEVPREDLLMFIFSIGYSFSFHPFD
jgi:hypothetical protein